MKKLISLVSLFFLNSTFAITTTDKLVENGAPREATEFVMNYYNKNKHKLNRHDWIGIADYTQHAGEKRFYLLNLNDYRVLNYKVSHGRGLDSQNSWTRLNRCQNNNGTYTNSSRPGPYRVDEYYYNPNNSGKGWPSYRRNGRLANGILMTGLSDLTLDATRNSVVMHEANYNKNRSYAYGMGRSYGCPAFVPTEGRKVFDRLQGGGLMFVYASQCPVMYNLE